MNELQKFAECQATVFEVKKRLFEPTNSKNTKEVKNFVVYQDTNWEIKITGKRLNQLHKDILDIITMTSKTIIKKDRVARFFSLYDVQKHLQYKSKFNNKWLKEKIEQDLSRLQIVIKDKKTGDYIGFDIIDVFRWSEKHQSYGLVYSELYTTFFENKIGINYKYYLDDILKLKYGVTKAAIRYLISHKEGINININKLLENIGITGTKRNIEKQRAKLLQELEKVKDKFNIKLLKTTSDKRTNSDITIVYKRLPNVKFYYPSKDKKQISD